MLSLPLCSDDCCASSTELAGNNAAPDKAMSSIPGFGNLMIYLVRCGGFADS